MTISTSYREQTITSEYTATVSTDNKAVADTKVEAPQTNQVQDQSFTDKFEAAITTGVRKLADILDPQIPTGEKDVKLWAKQEKAAYEKAKNYMAIGDQGQQNACGTTSQANALSMFGLPFRDEKDFQFIDKAIRPFSAFGGTPTGPGDIVSFARELGMQAQQYSKCDLEDVARQLRAGHTVTVVTNYQSPQTAESSRGVHYVNIIGVERDASGEISSVHVRNPWGVDFRDEEIPADEFMKMWTNVHAAGNPTGGIEDVLLAVPVCDRTMIVIDAPDGEKLEPAGLMKNFRNSNVNVVMNGVNGLAAGVNAVKGGAVMAGIGQVTGSVINTVVGGSCYIVGELIGKNMEEGGDKLMAIGKDMLQGNFWQKVGGGLAIFFGAISKAIGWVLNTFTNIQSAILDKITNLLSKSGEKFNARQALTEAINNDAEARAAMAPYTKEEQFTGMEHASVGTKKEMFLLLAHEGKATEKEQAAAFEVLKAAKNRGDLAELVKQLGGKDEVAKVFTDNSHDVNGLLKSIR